MTPNLPDLPDLLPIHIPFIPDGDVVTIRGVDLMRVGDSSIRLSDLLSHPALYSMLEQLPQVPAPVNEIHSGGVYIREMRIPAGTIIIGKRHRHSTCNVLMSGEITLMLDPPGHGSITRIRAPLISTTEPGVRKIVYTHTDVIFVNFHPNPDGITDPDELERMFIVPEDQGNEVLL